MKIDFDVDIDMANRDKLLCVLDNITGSIKRPGGMEKHNTGVYIQPIPHNPAYWLEQHRPQRSRRNRLLQIRCT